MLETLRLVRGAVSERNLVSVLTHFHVTPNGKIYGSNGRISIEAPFPVIHDAPITVPAIKFLRRVDQCEGDPELVVKGDTLYIKSKVRKKRRFHLPLSKDEYHIPQTGGQRYEVPDPEAYLESIRRVEPFVSSDATRPWAMSILHKKNNLIATNNVVLAKTKVAWPDEFPTFGLPDFAVHEVSRIKRKPKALWISENSVCLEMNDDIWVRSVIYDAEWPEYVDDMVPDTSGLPSLPQDAEQVARDMAQADIDERMPIVIFEGKKIRTREGDEGGEDELEGDVGNAAFQSTPLLLVLKYATHMDLTPFPKPCPWKGPNIEGVIVGVRL